MHQPAKLVLDRDHAVVENSGLHHTGCFHHVESRFLNEQLVLTLIILVSFQILLLDHLLQELTKCSLNLNEFELYEDGRVGDLQGAGPVRSLRLRAVWLFFPAVIQRRART